MSVQTPLERGKACSRCRRRKMRCDGQRPACTQCVRSDRAEDCEYLDGPGPTQNQLLEEEIARLEGRIAQLSSGTSSLTLHDPYATWNDTNQPPQAPEAAADPTRTLVRQFVQHATDYGFFLHVPRFLDKVFTPSGGPNHGLKILLNVIYLLGAALSQNPQMQALEQAYLTRALQHLPAALPEDPRGAIYVLQAEVLLANYFFNASRQLEGMYHTNAAASIALASKLHLIRSSRQQRGPSDAGTYTVPPPMDALEEGERINGFWTVFILDRCWAVASGSSPAFRDDESTGTQIDTPWPMDLTMYESGGLPRDFRSMRTVHSYVTGTESDTNITTQCILTMHAKAAILYEGAARLASRYNPASQTSFQTLDRRIERFRQILPRMDRFDPSRVDVVRAALLAHTIAHCASIQLHSPLAQDRAGGAAARTRMLQAATAAVRDAQGVPLPILGCLNPFMAIVWSSVGQVLVKGLDAARATGGNTATLSSEIDRLVVAMQQGKASALMKKQLQTIRPTRPAA